MKLEDLLKKLTHDTQILIKSQNVNTSDTLEIYDGLVEDVPYTLADEPIEFEECIEIENGRLVVITGIPKRRKIARNNQEWLDTLNEEDTLLHLMGVIYNYDVGTIREEGKFDESYWSKQRDDMLTFCEERLGNLLADKKLREWYGRCESK